MLLFNAVFAGFAFAAETAPTTQKKLNVVALGDSITIGYPTPSSSTFPNFIGEECNEVTKFGAIGDTSASLLGSLTGNVLNFSNAAKQADVVTVNIGSNDFLGATGVGALLKSLKDNANDPAGLQTALTANPITPLTVEQLNTYRVSLSAIVAMADTQADAPIILYNLYNPIVVNQELDNALNGKLTELHNFVEQELSKVNIVISEVGNSTGAKVVDAKSTIASNPSAFILPLDIHPTVAGHKALAKLADNVIASLQVQEPEEDLNPCGGCDEEPVEEPEGCTQTPPEEEEPPVEEPGETPGENPPTEEPKENPAPQPPAPEQPKVETPKTAPVKAQAKVLTSGSELPNTATPIYNYLIIGLAVAFIGMITFGIQQYHQKRNQSI